MERATVVYNERGDYINVILPPHGSVGSLTVDVCEHLGLSASLYALHLKGAGRAQASAPLASLPRPVVCILVSLAAQQASSLPSAGGQQPSLRRGAHLAGPPSAGRLSPMLGPASAYAAALAAPLRPSLLSQSLPLPAMDLGAQPCAAVLRLWLHLCRACLLELQRDAPPRPMERMPCLPLPAALAALSAAASAAGVGEQGQCEAALRQWAAAAPPWVGLAQCCRALATQQQQSSLLFYFARALAGHAAARMAPASPQLHHWVLPQALGLSPSYLARTTAWCIDTVLSGDWGLRQALKDGSEGAGAQQLPPLHQALHCLAEAYSTPEGQLTFHRLLTLGTDLGLIKHFGAPLTVWAAAFFLAIQASLAPLAALSLPAPGGGAAPLPQSALAALEQCTLPPASLVLVLCHLSQWCSAQWVQECSGAHASAAAPVPLPTMPVEQSAGGCAQRMLHTLFAMGGRRCLFPLAIVACARGDALASHSALKLASALQIIASALIKSRAEALGHSHAPEPPQPPQQLPGAPWPAAAALLRAGKQLTQAFHALRVGDGSAGGRAEVGAWSSALSAGKCGDAASVRAVLQVIEGVVEREIEGAGGADPPTPVLPVYDSLLMALQVCLEPLVCSGASQAEGRGSLSSPAAPEGGAGCEWDWASNFDTALPTIGGEDDRSCLVQPRPSPLSLLTPLGTPHPSPPPRHQLSPLHPFPRPSRCSAALHPPRAAPPRSLHPLPSPQASSL